MSKEAMIQLDHIDVTFQQKKRQIQAVKRCDHSKWRRYLWDCGLFGAGKSTDFELINLLQVPSAGTITVDERCDLSRSGDLKPAFGNVRISGWSSNLLTYWLKWLSQKMLLSPSSILNETKNKRMKVAKIVGTSWSSWPCRKVPSPLSGGAKQ